MRAQMICLFIGVFFLGHYGIDALLCFECNSHNDSRCAEPLPPDVLKTNCSQHPDGDKYTMCRKITQIIEFSVNKLPADSRTIRGCGWDESSYKGTCYQRSGFGGRQEVCSCTNDYCNGAQGSTPNIVLFSMMVAGLLAFWHK